MNPINIAISRVKFEIPREIINEAFAPRRYDPARNERFRDNRIPVGVDSVIRREVIEGRVMIDINLCSGVETTIPLHEVPVERIDDWNLIYRIPKSMTSNRNITAVYSVSYFPGNGYGLGRMAPNNSSLINEAAAGVFLAESAFATAGSANVMLIDDNTVLVTDGRIIPSRLWLRCMISHDSNLNNLPTRAMDTFAELVVVATKAYIYNNLNILMDEGQIKSGVSIGKYREVVDGYSDAQQLYKDMLKEKWRPVAAMSDHTRWRRIIAMTVGGRH